MRLAKPRVDIGLNTNDLQPMLSFWQKEVRLPFDHVLAIQEGLRQHRHDARGSVVKINHYREAIPDAPRAGYTELLIARDGIVTPREMKDPDGNRVTLVPPGTDGIEQVAILLRVKDLGRHKKFYAEALGLPETKHFGGAAFRAGETLILLEQYARANTDVGFEGKGWRYITFQVFKVDEEHANILAKGGTEAMAPRTLGTTARISMVRDPDGNWIEISQRASITGSLER
jgi:lactoylglutathione lyase